MRVVAKVRLTPTSHLGWVLLDPGLERAEVELPERDVLPNGRELIGVDPGLEFLEPAGVGQQDEHRHEATFVEQFHGLVPVARGIAEALHLPWSMPRSANVGSRAATSSSARMYDIALIVLSCVRADTAVAWAVYGGAALLSLLALVFLLQN